MGHHKLDEQPFVLEGRFLGFLFKDGYKVKYLKVLMNNREWLIEVSKSLRKEISPDFPVGEWVQVSGWQKYSSKYPVPKLKADAIVAVPPGQSSADGDRPSEPVATQSSRDRSLSTSGKILICGKSDCWKRGGKAVCAALKTELSERNLDDQITIKTTGCMKHCKAGPNIVVMPEKKRYSRITPDDVDDILDAHFAPAPAVSEPIDSEPTPEPVAVESVNPVPAPEPVAVTQ